MTCGHDLLPLHYLRSVPKVREIFQRGFLTVFGAILPLAAYWHQDGDTALFSRGLGRTSARPFHKFLVTRIDCVENGYFCINRPKNAAPFVLVHKRLCDTNTVLTRYPFIVGVYFPRRT